MNGNEYIQTGAVDLSRKREEEPSISTTVVRLNILDYKKARQSRQQAEVIQSALC